MRKKFISMKYFTFSLVFLTELKEKLQSKEAQKESQKGIFEKLHGWISSLGWGGKEKSKHTKILRKNTIKLHLIWNYSQNGVLDRKNEIKIEIKWENKDNQWILVSLYN